MKKAFLGVLTCGIVATIATNSMAAETGYLCSVNFVPGSTSGGSFGYVAMTVYAAANCQGTPGNTYWICSSNASNVKCTSSLAYRATSQAEIATIAEMASIAAADDIQVTVNTTASCAGGGTLCATNVQY